MSLVGKLCRSAIGLPLLAGLFVGIQTPSAGAAVIYDFVGTCTSGCVGQAEAVLTLADTYTPGTELQNADFVSLSYMSSSGSYTIPGDGTFLFFGSTGVSPILPASPPEDQADVFIDFDLDGTLFATDVGLWDSAFIPGLGIDDDGTEYSWTLRPGDAVPEPAIALLLLVSVGLLVGHRRWTPAMHG